jgi:ribosomal protein L39E
MHEERDLLLKQVFPAMRWKLEERGIGWNEVDLRWGITESEAQAGQVVPICLSEVSQCIPYFICILGGRYGWVPTELPAWLLEQETWLKDSPGISVTEMEIRQARRIAKEAGAHFFFYFRDPDYEPKEFKDAEKEPLAYTQKLDKLKSEIRTWEYKVRDYCAPGELADLVARDLTNCLDSLYPESASKKTIAARQADVTLRRLQTLRVGRDREVEQLAEVARDFHCLTVFGPPGIGKSTLVSRWLEEEASRPRSQEPARFFLPWGAGSRKQMITLVAHIGIRRDLNRLPSLLRELLDQAGKHLASPVRMPQDNYGLPVVFQDMLTQLTGKFRVRLVLDGLEHLEDSFGAHDLAWLPHPLPKDLQVVATAVDGALREEMQRRNWRSLELKALGSDEAIQATEEILKLHRKRLAEPLINELTGGPLGGHPRFLGMAVEELRVMGRHEQLQAHVTVLRTAGTLSELTLHILDRWERDYLVRGNPLSPRALGLLWAAHDGLTEPEWVAAIGGKNGRLPALHWAPLFAVMRQFLLSVEARLDFLVPELRAAVRERYAPNELVAHRLHLELADYFNTLPWSARKADQLPYQLASGGDWKALGRVLLDSGYLCQQHALVPGQAASLATRLELHEPAWWLARLQEVAETGMGLPEADMQLSRLLLELRRDDLAERLWNGMRRSVPPELRAEYAELGARILQARGLYRQAYEALKEPAAQYRTLNQPRRLSGVLGRQAFLAYEMGSLEEAIQLHGEEEVICRQTEDYQGELQSVTNQARKSFSPARRYWRASRRTTPPWPPSLARERYPCSAGAPIARRPCRLTSRKPSWAAWGSAGSWRR